MLSVLAYVLADDGQATLQALQQFLVLLLMMFLFFYCWFLQECLLDLPADDRRGPPWMVWLLILPYIGRIVALVVLPFVVPGSFQSFFKRRGDQRFGDCGRGLGLVSVVSLIIGIELLVFGMQAYGMTLLMIALLLLVRYTWILMRMRREVRRFHRIEMARRMAGRS